ncbi:hypothetical protein AB205_0084650, partial [Aquarana catesbeiana]
STSSNCTPSCQWTQWFNVDRPTNKLDGGDLETLDNIRDHGYNICQAPKDINCRSVRFPYIPYTYLLYKSQCDRSTGLICLNRDNMDPCIDFEVQLLCCTCEEEPSNAAMLPAVTTKTPATHCENPRCSWTQWFNTQNPTPDPDGGEFENITTIRNQGYSVCDFPKDIQCRLGRFPYIPLNMLYYVQECSVLHGLVCLNKNQQDEKCLDYEVQFLCCDCSSTLMQSLIIPEVTTNLTTLVTSKYSARETPNATEVLPTTQDMFIEPNEGSVILPNN